MYLSRTITAPTFVRKHVERDDATSAMAKKYSSHVGRVPAGRSLRVGTSKVWETIKIKFFTGKRGNMAEGREGGEAPDPKARSRELFEVVKQTPFYYVTTGIVRGTGVDPRDVERKPLVAVVNTWNELNPGHRHLRQLAAAVKWGVLEAGGVPFEFNTVAPCDGWANGNVGMRFILPQREVIADSIEAMVQAHNLDAMVCLTSCDKVNPAVVMAALRLDLPTVVVPGGPNLYEIRWHGRNPKINQDLYEDTDLKLKCITCGTAGSCEIMGTANTFQCLVEAMGLTLPNAATAPAVSVDKELVARLSGRQVVKLLEKGVTARAVLTPAALRNALTVDVAIGGSTNSCLHLPAIAHEMGVEFDLDWFNEASEKVPTIANVFPTGDYGVSDLYRAGGVPAVMATIREHLDLDCLTVSGKPWRRLLRRVKVLDDDVIRPLDRPVHPKGGTVVLRGNLAPEGAVLKQSAVGDPKMLEFTGEVLAFESEREALGALAAGRVENGTVVVIRNEGPKGGPGMPEMLAFTASLMLFKELREVALVTDGRFSGGTWGPCVGHVCPEAYSGGPIALVRDGDVVKIDVENKRLDVDLDDAELAERRASWKPVEREVKSPLLSRYRKLVTSAAKGAVLEW
ncbi:MAG: dihydroxy-acid dehydratase [Promethearchaeota archaeon]